MSLLPLLRDVTYDYPDGCRIQFSVLTSKWKAWWADKTSLRDDFDTPEQAAEALAGGREGLSGKPKTASTIENITQSRRNIK